MALPVRRLNIIASCTDRKTLSVPDVLRLRHLQPGAIDVRMHEWATRVACYTGPSRTALHLYAGDHWSVVRSLPELASGQGIEASLSVLSAGFGLVSSETQLYPYGATFAYGHPDSVGSNSQDLATWWASLSTIAAKAGVKVHKTLTEVMQANPRAIHFVIAS